MFFDLRKNKIYRERFFDLRVRSIFESYKREIGGYSSIFDREIHVFYFRLRRTNTIDSSFFSPRRSEIDDNNSFVLLSRTIVYHPSISIFDRRSIFEKNHFEEILSSKNSLFSMFGSKIEEPLLSTIYRLAGLPRPPPCRAPELPRP